MLPFPRGDCNSFTKLHENFTAPPGPFWRFRLPAREGGGPGAVSPPGSRTAARLHGGRPFPIVSVLPGSLTAEICSACGKVRPSPALARRARSAGLPGKPPGPLPILDAPYSRLSSSSRWASYPGLLPRGLPPSGGPSFALPRRRSTPPAARSGLRRTLGGAGAPGPLCGPPGQAPGASAHFGPPYSRLSSSSRWASYPGLPRRANMFFL